MAHTSKVEKNNPVKDTESLDHGLEMSPTPLQLVASSSAGEGGEENSQNQNWSSKDRGSGVSQIPKQECMQCKGRNSLGTSVRQMKEACHGTNRIGNLKIPGVAEHRAIMEDYIATVDPTAELEYAIPGSSASGATGYADIASATTGEIWEIKPMSSIILGALEAARYVASAKISCSKSVPWHLGANYASKVLVHPNSALELVAFKAAAGVIGYWTRKKQPSRKPYEVPVPVPEVKKVPSLEEQIKKFVKDVLEEGKDATESAEKWLKEHPEVAAAIIGLGIVGIIALVLDDLTLIGVADDGAIPVIWALMKVAWKYA